MKFKIIVLVFFLVMAEMAFAQSRSTKKAKVILAINEKNMESLSLELFDDKDVKGLKKRHPGSLFYMGLLAGSYELEKRKVLPEAGATITIFTEHRFLPNEEVFSNENFDMGSQLFIGDVKTKIISNNKGELVLETQQ